MNNPMKNPRSIGEISHIKYHTRLGLGFSISDERHKALTACANRASREIFTYYIFDN